MYELILGETTLTLALAIGVTMLAIGPRLTPRLLLFNFVPAIACAFYALALLNSRNHSGLDLLACFLFEFLILFLCGLLLRQMLACVRGMQTTPHLTTNLLRGVFLAQIALSVPILVSEGFGIFSGGSRIDYLASHPLMKYFTYAILLMTTVQTGLLAARFTQSGKLKQLDILVLGWNLAYSIISGSKGGFFLWLVSIAALVTYRFAHLRTRNLIGLVMLVIVGVVTTLYVLSNFFGLTTIELSNVIMARIFLTNDARALALDLRPTIDPGINFLAESFRSIAPIFGTPPVNPPLGQYLFVESFGLGGSSGANSSLTALVIAYVPANAAFLPLAVFAVVAFLMYVAANLTASLMTNLPTKFAVYSGMFLVLMLLSQDFLALQVLLPVVVLFFMTLFIKHGKRVHIVSTSVTHA